MADMEKVIKGLHQHVEGSMYDRCGECPYYKFDADGFSCRDELLCDALVMLKERDEPIKPTLNESHSYVSDAFKCGKCGHTIRFHAKYCEECGHEVAWDD